MRFLAPAVVVALALTVPAAAAQAPADEGRTLLYFHLDGFQLIPINKQAPPPESAAAYQPGILGQSLSCLAGGHPLLGQEWHTFRGYSAPWTVAYGNARPAPVFLAGLGGNLTLDGEAQPVLVWYLFTGSGVGGAGDQAPLPAPEAKVQAAIRTGAQPTADRDDMDAGALIASGALTGTLAGAATAGLSDAGVRYVGQVGGRHVYEYAIPLQVEAGVPVPGDQGFNVRVDVAVDDPACSQGYLMPNLVGVHSDAQNRPRLDLRVANPLHTQRLEAAWVGADLVLTARVQSVWGSYDIANVTVSIEGPSQPASLQFVDYRFVPHHETGRRPAEFAWVWNQTDAPIAPGSYVARIAYEDLQGTARIEETLAFEIAGGRESPAAGAAALLFLGALAALRRR